MKKYVVLLLFVSFLITSCGDDKKTEDGDKKEMTMSESDSKQQRNKKVVMESIDNFTKGNIDAVFKDVAPSFVDYTDGTMPPISNLDSLKGFIRMMQASIENYKGQNIVTYADGDHVLVYGDWGGTFKNDLMGIKATGKPVSFKDVDIFTLNDEGKITEHRSIQNLAAVLMAASAMK